MKIDKLNLNGKKDSIEVLDKIFSVKINKKLINNVLYKTNANYKGRHAKTKQQNEVSGPTSKIYAQKGTGNARHASRKAPIFVGGGIAHGPNGELSYKKRKLNKTEKKQSIASLISEKIKDKNLLVFSDFKIEIKKTKEMSTIIKKFELSDSLIILDKSSKEKIEKSIRNIPNIKVTDINHFSAFDLVKFKKTVFTESSVKELEKLKTNIEKIFKVNVTKINIINKQNRLKLTRGRKVKVSGFKKAIVTLKKGQSIDLTTGI